MKDPEAHRLAEAIIATTGETITRAVIRSLEERLDRLRGNRNTPEMLAADLRAIAKRAAPHIQTPYADHADYLYDERGLPR